MTVCNACQQPVNDPTRGIDGELYHPEHVPEV